MQIKSDEATTRRIQIHWLRSRVPVPRRSNIHIAPGGPESIELLDAATSSPRLRVFPLPSVPPPFAAACENRGNSPAEAHIRPRSLRDPIDLHGFL